ncbi:MAG TPA: PEGA domain-containing protein [Candidatus Nanopelagicales bacterium]|nr:PEGA domain-containing protein [Candidatus Nanopelagicales bacterium]
MVDPLRIVVPLLMFSAVVVGPSAAWCEGLAAAGTSKGAAAQGPSFAESLRRGERARKAKRWAEAAEGYRAAYALEPRPEIAGELGECEVQLGRFREAAEHLAIGLEDPEALTDEQWRRFQSAQERAEREIATVAIAANPTAAEVWVDERSLGAPRDSYVVFLDPGRHTFRARLAGYHDGVTTIEMKAGSAQQVSLVLREHRAPPPPPPAPPRCRAGVDCGGKVAGTLRSIGFATAGGALALGAGMIIAGEVLDAELKERTAGLARYDCRGKQSTPWCMGLRELRSTRDKLASAGMIGLVAGGTVGLVTLSSLWWAPGSPSARVGVAPVVGPGEAGASVYGHW